MKYFLKNFLGLFIPFEDDPDPKPDPDPDPDPDPTPKSIDPDGRPDWCPETFWDEDMKAPRTEVMARSYGEIKDKMNTKTEELKAEITAEMKASAPENYEFKMPDDLDIPDNIDFDLSKDDPMVDWFFGFAKENGLSQETVNSALSSYIKIELAGMPNIEDEIKLLGDHGQDRMLRVHTWIDSKLTKDEAASLHPLLSSAAQVMALEKLMKSGGPGDFDGDTSPAGLTLGELRQMQADPRYIGGQDKEFIKKVQDGYARLYNTK